MTAIGDDHVSRYVPVCGDAATVAHTPREIALIAGNANSRGVQADRHAIGAVFSQAIGDGNRFSR